MTSNRVFPGGNVIVRYGVASELGPSRGSLNGRTPGASGVICQLSPARLDLSVMANEPRVLPSLPKVPSEVQQPLAPYEPLCAIFRRYLHGQKLKFTPERALILEAVLGKSGLFQAEALADELRTVGHHVSRATVYRTLNHLQDAGILKQVFFDNKQSYFEVVAGRQANDYLICVDTGQVIEFSSQRLRQLRDEICREHGFDPVSHQLHIYGVSPQGRGQRHGKA